MHCEVDVISDRCEACEIGDRCEVCDDVVDPCKVIDGDGCGCEDHDETRDIKIQDSSVSVGSIGELDCDCKSVEKLYGDEAGVAGISGATLSLGDIGYRSTDMSKSRKRGFKLPDTFDSKFRCVIKKNI